MNKTVKIKADDVERLKAQGYCRVSRRHLILARIDREDWREHMARDHAPWDWKGDGMAWATTNGMDDHYRRCYSKDWIYVDPGSHVQFLKFPGSADGPGQFMGKPRWEKAPVPVPPEFVPQYRKKGAPEVEPASTSESQPDLAPGSLAPDAAQVFCVIGAVIGAGWLMVLIIQWLLEKSS